MPRNMPISSNSPDRTSDLVSPTSTVPPAERFGSRHIGPDAGERAAMLRIVGVPSMDALIDEVIPDGIRLEAPLNLPPAIGEHEFLRSLRQTASRNQIFRSFLGLGYYDCFTPSVSRYRSVRDRIW